MGVITSVAVCCLTGSSVALKIAHHREHGRIRPEGPIKSRGAEDRWRRLALTPSVFTPVLQRKLGQTVCPICYEALKGDSVAVLKCDHVYHFACLKAYALHRPGAHATPLLCPVCQQDAIAR